jgi:uncharacterized protein YfiM (DUF2279 family)
LKHLWKVFVASLVIGFTPVTLQAQAKHVAQEDRLIGPDKLKHFFIAGFVESMTFAGLQAANANRGTARTAAIGLTAAVSIGREVHDRKTKGLFSVRDLAWDAIGATAALLVINKTQK